MFSKNHIVSVRQMRRLLVLDLFAATGLVLPMAVGRLCGTAGIFAILAGGAAAAVFAGLLLKLAARCRSGYPDFCREMLGERAGQAVMAIYAVKYFVTAALLLGVFAQIINHTFLTDIPRAVLGTAMLLICIYSVFKGLETRARLGEMLVYVVIVPIVLIIFLSIPQIHPERLWPVRLLTREQAVQETADAAGVVGLIWAAVITFAMFSVVEWLLFLRPHVKQRQKALRGMIGGIAWPVVLNLLLLVVCIGVFSVAGMNNEQWPAVTLMQIVRFPGGFLSRQDGLMLAFWMAGMFMLISGSIYYGMESFKSLSKKLCKSWVIIFPGIFILGCFLCIYLNDATRLFIRYMVFIYLPLTLAVPLLLGLAGPFKRSFGSKKGDGRRILPKTERAGKQKGRRMAAFILALAWAAGGMGLSGCGDLVEIEDRNFVMCLGIDTGPDGLEVSLGFPDLKALTGDGDNIHYPAVTLSGDSMEDVEAAYRAGSNKRLDYGQLQMIVFGRKMMKDSAQMREVLEYIREQPAFTRTVLVCMADDRAGDIVALDESVNGSIGFYLRQMFDNNYKEYRLTVGDLIIGLSLTDETGQIAVAAPGENGPKIINTEQIRGFYSAS